MKTFSFLSIFMAVTVAAYLVGCGPASYPKEKLESSVIELCKKEYNLDVKAKHAGNTLAVFMPYEEFLDANFALTEGATEDLNDVLLSISRVSLSTDAELEFYVLIVQDPRIPDIQMIIIKSVDDLKRFFYGNISRSEYFKRMLYDVNFTPQAQKEKLIKNLFVNLKIEGVEDALDTYLRKIGIDTINDIGYWNDTFFIKEIVKTEFYAKQIESRIKLELRADDVMNKKYRIVDLKGSFNKTEKENAFRLDTEIRALEADKGKETEKTIDAENILKMCLKVASDVICGYKYEDFETLEIVDQINASRISLDKETLFKFYKNKVNFSDITIQAIS